MLLIMRLIILEVFSIVNLSFDMWATSVWNWLDILSYLLSIAITSLPQGWSNTMGFCSDFENRRVDPQGVDLAVQHLVAVAMIIIWVRFLYFFVAFKVTGPTVQMIIQILLDIGFFLMLIIAILIGFGLAFFVLFRSEDRVLFQNEQVIGFSQESFTNFMEMDNQQECVEQLYLNDNTTDIIGSMGRQMARLVTMMIGDFNTDCFLESRVNVLSTILFVLFILFLAITLLNLMIAIMNDSYNIIKEKKESRFYKGRAELVDEMETSIPPGAQKCFQQCYVHVLMPAEESQRGIKSSSWMWEDDNTF
eukprot:TRINITY_DN14642_c1_g1_i1.p1 TRINITY_DN14642_c1_g1~~TRINITY_DN14642_c1_g1_i1.p1  ORF type:complete len:306 (+),score=1.57 TRINITY_DN14642_c1_g1_i1:121-1038(+)